MQLVPDRDLNTVCFKLSVQAFNGRCVRVSANTYVLKLLHIFGNLCEKFSG
jgi:hypothetical protein